MPTRNHRAYEHLRKHSWAEQLITEIDLRGGISNKANEGNLFTLRFAWELSLACPEGTVTYEFPAGVGKTTVDFRLEANGKNWLFECMAINESQTTQSKWKSSRKEIAPGIFSESASFDGRSLEKKCRPEAELHRVSQSIWQHVWKPGKGYSKFPERSDSLANILVVSMAGLEGMGDPDPYQCREIAFGSENIPIEWRSAELLGLFNTTNSEPGAVAIRERVDLLVFVDDFHGIYGDDRIRNSSHRVVNPSSQPWVKAEYPFRPTAALADQD